MSQVAKTEPKGVQMEPKGSQMEPKWGPKWARATPKWDSVDEYQEVINFCKFLMAFWCNFGAILGPTSRKKCFKFPYGNQHGKGRQNVTQIRRFLMNKSLKNIDFCMIFIKMLIMLKPLFYCSKTRYLKDSMVQKIMKNIWKHIV